MKVGNCKMVKYGKLEWGMEEKPVTPGALVPIVPPEATGLHQVETQETGEHRGQEIFISARKGHPENEDAPGDILGWIPGTGLCPGDILAHFPFSGLGNHKGGPLWF